jgi:hypothetical protein
MNSFYLAEVLPYLSSQDIINFCGTHKAHRELCQDPKVWRYLLQQVYPEHQRYFSDPRREYLMLLVLKEFVEKLAGIVMRLYQQPLKYSLREDTPYNKHKEMPIDRNWGTMISYFVKYPYIYYHDPVIRITKPDEHPLTYEQVYNHIATRFNEMQKGWYINKDHVRDGYIAIGNHQKYGIFSGVTPGKLYHLILHKIPRIIQSDGYLWVNKADYNLLRNGLGFDLPPWQDDFLIPKKTE